MRWVILILLLVQPALGAKIYVNTSENFFLKTTVKQIIHTSESLFLRVSEPKHVLLVREELFLSTKSFCIDNEPPNISAVLGSPTIVTGDPASVFANITDACGVSNAFAILSGPKKYNVSMSPTATGFEATVIPSLPGNYTIFVEAVDKPGNRIVYRVGVLEVRKGCPNVWKNITRLSLISKGRLSESSLLFFLNTTTDPECMCSKRMLGLSGYSYAFWILEKNGSVAVINGVKAEKLCPSQPPLTDVSVQTRAAVYKNRLVYIKLAVWKS
ncbi:MAG: hypothetical protein GXO63_01675 [Candidatus Micrarchaeota archaeon]|nr:hypothetical protein [Candidatus Micrarchaeota archaeon]